MPRTNIKAEAHRIVANLREDAIWDNLMYQIYVRHAVEAGLEDSEAGRTIDNKGVHSYLSGVPSRKRETSRSIPGSWKSFSPRLPFAAE